MRRKLLLRKLQDEGVGYVELLLHRDGIISVSPLNLNGDTVRELLEYFAEVHTKGFISLMKVFDRYNALIIWETDMDVIRFLDGVYTAEMEDGIA